MASEKPGPGPGLEPQPVGLLAVGAGGGGGGGTGEPRGASGSGSVVLPAGMINPSVPIRNIRMKFAVLIGLIQVGEVSNRDIVETVLNLVREPGALPSASPPPPPPSAPTAAAPRPWEQVVGLCCQRSPLPEPPASLLSSGALLPPELSAQLNIARYPSSRP